MIYAKDEKSSTELFYSSEKININVNKFRQSATISRGGFLKKFFLFLLLFISCFLLHNVTSQNPPLERLNASSKVDLSSDTTNDNLDEEW